MVDSVPNHHGALPPLSLYVHIPWCERKCPYCDFNSHVSANALPEADYLAALTRDLASQQAWAQGRRLSSIFIGGGTPSLFSAHTIGAILNQAERQIGFEPDIEITMEANPGSSEQRKFADLHAAGLNRLSIGIQSFDDAALNALGRIHNRALAHTAISGAQAAGFERINLDLMHGLPNQTPASAMADLQQAIDTGVSHVSWYQLTIEQNTEFYRFPPRLPDDDILADIQDQGMDRLKQAGFSQYEISAFSKPGQHAQHNMNYWQFGDYLAIGAGAHGKVTLPNEGIVRFNNTRLPRDYLNRIDNYIAQRQTLAEDEPLFEGLMNALRLTDGIAQTDLLQRTGAQHAQVMKLCQPLVDQQLLTLQNQRIKATDLGRRYLNLVLEKLLD